MNTNSTDTDLDGFYLGDRVMHRISRSGRVGTVVANAWNYSRLVWVKWDGGAQPHEYPTSELKHAEEGN